MIKSNILDLKQITFSEWNEIKSLAIASTEKSELEKIPFFNYNHIDKAKKFIYSYRFLLNVYNLLYEAESSKTREELGRYLSCLEENYNELCYLISSIEQLNYGKSQKEKIIFEIVQKNEINELIDIFSMLIEQTAKINISKFKGVLMEGKSGLEYNKVMKRNELKIETFGYEGGNDEGDFDLEKDNLDVESKDNSFDEDELEVSNITKEDSEDYNEEIISNQE